MKIAVLADFESAAGYRLAGLEVIVAENANAAEKMLARLVQEGVYALIAVQATLIPDPYRIVKREMRGRELPVLLPVAFSDSAVADPGEEAKTYLRRLIVETIGYEIRIAD
ncbi:MAG: V-type ATP synthase subunit F [Deltaproteobacteria bacterium]